MKCWVVMEKYDAGDLVVLPNEQEALHLHVRRCREAPSETWIMFEAPRYRTAEQCPPVRDVFA